MSDYEDGAWVEEDMAAVERGEEEEIPHEEERVRESKKLKRKAQTIQTALQIKKSKPGLENEKQRQAMEMAEAGKNLFITGCAGTGKSWILQQIIQRSRELNRVVMVTAPTGTAACNIGGVTIHHAFNVDPKSNSVNSERNAKLWTELELLVLDEVSMLTPELLELLDKNARKHLQVEKPFGGIQVLFCGDFFQLPPVGSDRLAFESPVWTKLFSGDAGAQICLDRIYRQDNPRFIQFLNGVRTGTIDHQFASELSADYKRLSEEETYAETHLYLENAKVNALNNKRLSELGAVEHRFDAAIHVLKCPSGKRVEAEAWSNFSGERIVSMAVGAWVILTSNISVCNGLANGTKGRVVRFEKSGLPVVCFGNRNVLIRPHIYDVINTKTTRVQVTQIPLKLAWAMTVHKSQGQSIQNLYVDFTKVFQASLAYTALSRATDPATLRLANLDRKLKLKVDQRVLDFYSKF